MPRFRLGTHDKRQVFLQLGEHPAENDELVLVAVDDRGRGAFIAAMVVTMNDMVIQHEAARHAGQP